MSDIPDLARYFSVVFVYGPDPAILNICEEKSLEKHGAKIHFQKLLPPKTR